MQLSETHEKALEINRKIREKFGDRVCDFVIEDVIDVPGQTSFSIKFVAYKYFSIRLNYGRGRFGCCISNGEIGISLESSQKWWDTADFDVFLEELKQEIELRIPDKFLKAKGWL